MSNKITLTTSTLALGALLTGCAHTLPTGIALEETDSFDHRDDIIVSGAIHTENGKTAPGNIRVTVEGETFEGNEETFNGKQAFYKLTANNTADLHGKTYWVTVQAEDPEAEVECFIKDTGITHPTHVSESHGTGSATCRLVHN
ncbi:hypothetical protein [Rothia sp. ZJ932]|uniref:hypothetical protein n=1 Tax=Rothia sp. ZJ932 TaxID=2810516 RepID=UPI0019687E75|nr:hypothetical protein [Rothia sp. ZJ932]QRZ62429.1 hypothetical protein JR346_04915 [Rothia sp. ZJ932]